MHITRFTDYSLRVLMFLAARPDQLCTIREIAEAYDISRNHLMKVVQELSARGLVQAVRGKNGGLSLGRPAADINVGALVRTTEQDLAIVECFGPDNRCVISPACQLKHIFSGALEAFFRHLDGYTLADLLPGPHQAQLGQLLAFKAR